MVVAALAGWPLTLVTCVVTCLVYCQVSSTVTLMVVINIKYIITSFAFVLYADSITTKLKKKKSSKFFFNGSSHELSRSDQVTGQSIFFSDKKIKFELSIF